MFFGPFKREAENQDFRGNLARGGKWSDFDSSLKPLLLERAGKIQSELGKALMAIDFLIDGGEVYTLEVNLRPGFKYLEEVRGIEIGDHYAQWIVEQVLGEKTDKSS